MMKTKCKKCGCDFPNNEFTEFGCLYCESEKNSFRRSMNKLNELLDKHEKLKKGDEDENNN